MGLFTEKYAHLLKDVGILPVICFKNQGQLDTFLKAILKTKIRCVEILMRDAFTPDAIRYIKKNYPEIVVGAGTVSTLEKLSLATQCGSDYCVAPGTLDFLLDEAEKRGMPFLAGASTPSEIMKLNARGYTTVKYFPAECSGGVKALKLYEGALPGIDFLPTGGMTLDNFGDYSKCKNVLACGGGFMVPKTMLENGDSDGIYKIVCELINEFERIRSK